MRHRLFGKKLGRNHHERQALFRSLVKTLFLRGSLKTTSAKAKAITPLIEKISHYLVTKSDLIASRLLFRYFQDRLLVGRVITDFKQVFADQKSNFTQTKNIKYRQGDNALIVKLSFIKPFPSPVPKKEDPPKTKKPVNKKTAKNEK